MLSFAALVVFADVFAARALAWSGFAACVVWSLRRALTAGAPWLLGWWTSSRGAVGLCLLSASLGAAVNRVEVRARMTALGAQLHAFAEEERAHPVGLAAMARRDGAQLPRASTALPLCTWSYATPGGLLVRRCAASPDEIYDVSARRFVTRVP